ncbi:MAG: beta-ketoacyl-[acyl-carrier-protein] synthase family protein [Pirellulales bacterium]|nr:beta-ketoacyl-[acyl-carrier-protein] synthase family protein [Pirellulales bacterium]
MASSSQSRRVVITGMGVICPLGNTLDELWSGLSERRSAIGRLEWVDGRGLSTDLGAPAEQFRGEIDDFGPLESARKKAIRKALKLMCRETQMGVAAAQRALAHAGLVDETTPDGRYEPERIGIVYGSDYMLTDPDELSAAVAACLDTSAGDAAAGLDRRRFQYPRWGGEGMRQMTPLWLLKYLPNMPACHVAIYNDLRGPNNSLTQREAASNAAIGEALRTIQRGSAEIMVAGATGTRIHPMKAVHALLLEETATDVPPEQACRPFDRNRCGTVFGEGAGAVILESLESAQRRGAKILAEVLGFGSSTVVDRQRVAQRDRAAANALRLALADAGLSPAQIGHVHAHGLATHSADADEARAIGAAFGDRARDVPTVAAKSNFGNLGAGCGAVELVASVLALHNGRLFPVLNYTTPDPECPVRAVTRDDEPAGQNFVNLNFTPQGQATAIVVGAWDGR